MPHDGARMVPPHHRAAPPGRIMHRAACIGSHGAAPGRMGMWLGLSPKQITRKKNQAARGTGCYLLFAAMDLGQ
jgi:hypothetical protein